MARPRIASIGECMIELNAIDLDAGSARIGFAGDTLNVAVYLARLGCDVAYVTNLGTDAFSARMVRNFANEGIDTGMIGRHESRLPGLYSIEIDSKGERTFRYWREASAARTLFSGTGAGLDELSSFDVIYLSGITLAILPPDLRSALIDEAGRLRAAGRLVVFDNNYRPRLWPDAAAARDAMAAMWAATSIALPSHDDELALYPGQPAEQVLDRIASGGAAEVVLKNGSQGVTIRHGDRTLRPALRPAEAVLDTSGAGDSFNAGYLAARLGGADPADAAAAGHRLACRVIAHHGTVIPRDAMPG